MKSKWSIWGSLFFVVSLALFFALLRDLSRDLNSLLDITGISQNDSESENKSAENRAGAILGQNDGGHLFKGKIRRNVGLEEAQSEIRGSEADSPIYWDPSGNIPTYETSTSIEENPEKSSEKTDSQKKDRLSSSYFSVHFASHRDLNDAEAEVARLSGEGLHAWWAKKELAGKGVWFRVYIGKEKTWQGAIDLAEKLKESGTIKEIRVHRVKAR